MCLVYWNAILYNLSEGSGGSDHNKLCTESRTARPLGMLTFVVKQSTTPVRTFQQTGISKVIEPVGFVDEIIWDRRCSSKWTDTLFFVNICLMRKFNDGMYTTSVLIKSGEIR